MQKYRWGIIGTGMIAHKMADALTLIDNAEITAVMSRTAGNADKFAKEYGIANKFANIDDFAGSDKFDIAYIATPHNNHEKETVKCLQAGKAVLCEKPMGVNGREVDAMIQTAQQNGVFLTEAFWTYYFPAMQKALELVNNGSIGKPLMVDARFCFYKDKNPNDRKFSPYLAGGALLDIGLYCITLPQMVFNESPVEVKGMAAIGETGVDEASSYILKYSENRLATLTSSFRTVTHNDAWIFGEKGMIKIPMFWQPDEVILHVDGNEKKYTFERFGNGYTYEAMAVMKYLGENKKESDVFPLAKSRELIKILDQLRDEWGLKYPFE